MADVLPPDFDVELIGDNSTIPADTLAALRELAWRKAQADPIWFVENFWHVIDPQTMRWVKFDLRDYQLDDAEWIIDAFAVERARKLVLKARQIGWTTLALALAFHNAWFYSHHPWLVASQTEDDAKDTLRERVKDPYNMLPIWLRERGPQVTDQNSERISFDNGSNILSIPSTSRSGRSKVVYGVLLDEFAFTGTEAEGLLGALDPLCYGPMIVFSTAFGMGNPFHALWVESQRHDAEWDGRFRAWNVVPGRTKEWYEREKRKYRGRLWQFYQEYPSSAEEAFARTGRTVMPMDILRDVHDWCDPQFKVDLNLVSWENPTLYQESGYFTGGESGFADLEERDHELWVYEAPLVERDERGRMLRKPNYAIACDVAEGLEHGDRTSITVYNVNTYEEVATYLGYWPVEDLADLLYWLGETYHWALMGVERNNHGLVPLDRLRRMGYPRMYRMDFIGQQVRSDRTPKYGFHTNKATKPKMVNDFIRAVRDEVVDLHDSRFLAEASVFVSDGRGGYAASDGNHDDHVMSHLIGWQLCQDVGSYPIVYQEDAPFRLTFGAIKDAQMANALNPGGLATPSGQVQREKPRHSFVV